MKIFDLVIMGIKNLWRRKLRTSLTVLGVIIGTASIVVMLSLGIGMEQAFTKQLESWGSLNVLDVRPDYNSSSNGSSSRMTISSSRAREWVEPVITLDQIEKLKSIKNVSAVTPIYNKQATLTTGRYECNIRILGIDPNNMEAFDYSVQEGRLLQEGDENVALFGRRVSDQFYNPKDRGRGRGPREEVEINFLEDDIKFTIEEKDYNSNKKIRMKTLDGVGILTEGNWETDYAVVMNIEYLKKLEAEIERKNKNNKDNNQDEKKKRKKVEGYQNVKVRVEDIKNVDQVVEDVRALGLNTYSMVEQLNSMKKTSGIIQAVLGGIGAISLLVAAIGITNTMIMSIYERTKEIGVMKVIGAKLGDIKRMFLFEAAMIGLIGGLLGLLFSWIISIVLNKVGAGFIGGIVGGSPDGDPTKISIIPPYLALGALAFSTFIGIVSGFYPAKRATKLSALEAIRTE